MRVILTGATGFVGGEVLKQLLADETIKAVTCLSRRSIEVQQPKLTTVLHTDFTHWPTDLARSLAAHDAVIWALGAKATDVADAAEYERVTVISTLSFANAIANSLNHGFRFCYLSGMGADPAETSTFPWQKTTRHMKGRTERGLELLTKTGTAFRASSFRPGGILPRTTHGWVDRIFSPIAVRVDQLARAMIVETQVNGLPAYRVLSNGTIRKDLNDRS